MKKLLVIATLILATSTASAENNFRFGPLGLLLGAVNVSFDFQVNENWTAGPSLLYWNFETSSEGVFIDDFTIKAWGVGARANWFKNGVHTDGLYIGPSINYVDVEVETRDSGGDATGSASGLAATGIIGYGWFWESFNMMLGGGLSLPLGDLEVEVRDSSGSTTEEVDTAGGFALEYTLGWTF